MAVVKGLVTNYEVATYVSGASGPNGGSVSSSYIASFMVDGRMFRMHTGFPAGMANGDQVMVSGAVGKSGIFAVQYYVNATRKCHSPPPEFPILPYAAWVFLFVGFAIFSCCFAADLFALQQPQPPKIGDIIGVNLLVLPLGIFFFGFGRRWKNGIKKRVSAYKACMHELGLNES